MKKLTKSEQEFLVELITNKIVEKKQKELNEKVSNDPTFIEFKRKVDELNNMRDKLGEEYKLFDKELYDNTSLYSNYKVEFKVSTIETYSIRKQIEQKIMYDQVILGGIGEDFIEKVVNELS